MTIYLADTCDVQVESLKSEAGGMLLSYNNNENHNITHTGTDSWLDGCWTLLKHKNLLIGQDIIATVNQY